MFTSLELGKDDKELEQGGLSLRKNPLLFTIIDGCETLKALLAKNQITPDLVAGAKGLVLMRTDKIGFGISVTQGYGLVVSRLPNSASGWSAPLPLKVDGFSMGAVMGFSEQHTAILLSSDDDIQAFLKDKRSMKIGMDFGLSVGKKINQNAAMDASQAVQGIKAGMKQASGGGRSNEEQELGGRTRAFTVSKGYIVDVSLKGTSVEPDVDDMEAAYGEGTTPADILTGRVKAPTQAALLYNALKALEGKVGATIAGV